MQNNRIRLARLSEEESLDSDSDRLTPTPRLDDLLLQAVEPDAAVDDLAYKFV